MDAVIAASPGWQKEKLVNRLNRINLVQRLDGGREVNLYEMQSGRPQRTTEDTRVSDDDAEYIFATFRYRTVSENVIAGQRANHGKVWVVGGRLFPIEFKSPTEHDIDEDIELLEMHIHDGHRDGRD